MESAGEVTVGRLEPRGPQGWRGPALWLAAVGSFGLLLFLYHYLAVLAERGDPTPWKPFINEFTGALVSGLLFFPLRATVRRWPLTAASWRRRLPLYSRSSPAARRRPP